MAASRFASTSRGGAPSLRLLGPIEAITHSGSAVLTRKMEKGLVTVLALRPRSVVSTTSLVDTLWPESPPRTATKTLQGYVKRVRQFLKPLDANITYVGGSGYRLDLVPTSIDAIRFEALISESKSIRDPQRRADSLAGALALWNGDPFGGCDLDQLSLDRRRLYRSRSAARSAWAETSFELGRTSDAIDALRFYLTEEETNERLWLHLAAFLYLNGDPVAALRAIDEARSVLADAVGVTIGPELAELELAALQHDDVEACYRRLAGLDETTMYASHILPPVVSIPKWAGRLIDRAVIVDQIQTHIDGGPSVTTAVGPGGTGKTRCSAEAARRSTLPCRGFIDLSTISSAPDMILHLVGYFGSTDHDEPLTAIASHLKNDRCLIVLDNVEQIPGAAGVIKQLAAASPAVSWLVTSRSRLGIQEERVVRLGSLSFAESDKTTSPAAQLLLAAAERQGINLDHADVPIVETIAAELGGLPLALELAGCQLAHRSPAELLRELDQPLDVLVDTERDLSRHRSMRRCIDFGRQTLSDPATRLLDLLTQRPGGIRVSDLDGQWFGQTSVNPLLSELTDAGFTRSHVGPDGAARVLLPSVLRGLSPSSKEPALLAANEARLDARLRRRLMEIGFGDPRDLDPDLPDIRRILQAGIDQTSQLPSALTLGSTLIVYWWAGRVIEGREWLDRLIGHPEAAASPMYPHVLNSGAFLDFYVGDAQRAARRLDSLLDALDPAVADPASTSSTMARARALSLRCMIDAGWGDHDLAQQRANESVTLSTQVGGQQLIAVSLGNAGDAALAARDFSQASELFLDSIEAFRRIGETWLCAAPTARLGDLALAVGDRDGARVWYDRSITLWAQRDLGSGSPQTLSGLARLDILEGRLDAARDRLDHAMAVAQRCGSRWEFPWIVIGYAALAAELGRFDNGLRLFGLALGHGRRAGVAVERLVADELSALYSQANEHSVVRAAELEALVQSIQLEDLPAVTMEMR